MRTILFVLVGLYTWAGLAQDSTATYKKRVLEAAEIDILASYYSQDGDNAAVTGGLGTEKLTEFSPTIVVSVPLNADDVLTVDAGVSAYTSASSSNIDPFDGGENADPFVASSGASSSDLWAGGSINYAHSSDDRNEIWGAKASISSEYDYFSVGFGGSYTRLFNEKNTEVSVNVNVYLDTWKLIYPIEFRDVPTFEELDQKNRNSYSLGFGFSQILSKRLQGSMSVDLVQQQGLLSTPFQRVYFSDLPNRFRENFQLGDDIERLPDNRFKTAIGGRLNYFINETFIVRTFYRYYFDDWGISSHTASIEIPIKISDRFTVYPNYRFYNQTASDYFAPFETHLSSEEFYTSDFDLSEFSANQYGLGISYTDIFTKFHLGKYGLKSVDVTLNRYQRNTGLNYMLFSAGLKFVQY
ncbi:DUF3570 domain-containing protein [Aequorivita echinoideorum]|uniref:DUF3570 domain-containing protein n=1 Tax=Aequorivita echinoideorum TaxID=1549647 RepID=A0ABS5S2I9_9FLAO|nr:DUF3570 domain-containing protein [Aequorivita echinoideorum]MBT0607406.1 DUF3570 domain-containing protein [Aequorivita echinoideorum]